MATDAAQVIARSSRGPSMISVTVNGESTRVGASCTIADLLAVRGLTGKRVAVERNGAIVARSRHAEIELIEADRLEIVVAVGGG